MDSKDLNITDTTLLKQLNNTIIEGNKLRGDGESREEAKDSLRLKQGEIIKYYPNNDKALIKFSNGTVYGRILHPILSETMNVSFIPRGHQSTDKNGVYIEPYDRLFVLCLEIEHTANSDELAVLGFIGTGLTGDNSTGEIKVQVGDTCISVTTDYVNIQSSSVFWNGVPLSAPRFSNIYEKTDVDDKLASVTGNIESLNTDIQSRLATLENKVASIENNKTTNTNSENSPVISTSNSTEKGNLNITTNLQTTTSNNLFYGDIIIITLTDNYNKPVQDYNVDFRITRTSTGISKTYTKTTNEDGMTIIQTNLSSDEYTVEIICRETDNYNFKTTGQIQFKII